MTAACGQYGFAARIRLLPIRVTSVHVSRDGTSLASLLFDYHLACINNQL